VSNKHNEGGQQKMSQLVISTKSNYFSFMLI